jgi:hypothetical protein
MEENERRERIAACAQLLAIQQHTEVVIGSASATSEREVSDLKSKLVEQKELIAELKVKRVFGRKPLPGAFPKHSLHF